MLILTIIMIIYIIFKYIIALSKKYSKKEFKNKKEHSESDYRFLNEVQKVKKETEKENSLCHGGREVG